MPKLFSSALHGLAVSLLLGAPALAGDYYVSSSSGSNGNDGLTPGTSWASITFALNNVPLTSPTGVHTIHVAPGTYSVANGEVFPLALEQRTGSGGSDVEIVSDAGSAATTIVGTGLRTVFINSRRDFQTQIFYRTRITRLEGFRILPEQQGVYVAAVGGNLSPVLSDLRVEGGTGVGISLRSVADSFVGTSGDIVDAQVVDCHVSGVAGRGIELIGFGDLLIFTACSATLTNTTIRDNTGVGLKIDSEETLTTATLNGCRITGNGARGVALFDAGGNFGFPTVHAFDTLIADNDLGGVDMSNAGNFSGPFANLERCTVADNQGPGLRGGSFTGELTVDTSIVHGNTADVAGEFLVADIEFSDVGTGNPSASGTNISQVPLFVDAANGDYRLQDGSPCIDTGNPALALDPDGTRADMGAFPFAQDATSAYCTGKVNSLGCVPFVTWTGFASASAPQAFALSVRDVLPSEAGIVVYGFQAGNLNFHGGKLCVKAPLQRYLPVKLAKSSGAPPCSGVLTRNFNSRIQSGVDAMLTPGQTAYAQWRLRDAADPAGFGDSLSDAAQFLIAP